jgi:hypothetical protein
LVPVAQRIWSKRALQASGRRFAAGNGLPAADRKAFGIITGSFRETNL